MCHSFTGAVNYFVNDNIENQLLQVIRDVKFISQFCIYIINLTLFFLSITIHTRTRYYLKYHQFWSRNKTCRATKLGFRADAMPMYINFNNAL